MPGLEFEEPWLKNAVEVDAVGRILRPGPLRAVEVSRCSASVAMLLTPMGTKSVALVVNESELISSDGAHHYKVYHKCSEDLVHRSFKTPKEKEKCSYTKTPRDAT